MRWTEEVCINVPFRFLAVLLDLLLHAHRVVRLPSQALPAGSTRDTPHWRTCISPTVNLSESLVNHVTSLRATEQQISKQGALRTAPQLQPLDRRGEAVAFNNAGRHRKHAWLASPRVF